MRRLLLLACCAIIATIIAYFALGRGERAPTPLEQRVPDVARDSATSESETLRLDSALDGSFGAQPALRARAGEARLVGRVVDESRRALAQASIRVFALDVGPPKRGADAERRRQAGRAHAVVATSASDGSFELIASSIAGRLLRLEVETQDHRGAFAQDLSDEFEPSRSQIHEGDNDLGDLVVRFDGAILGSVHLNDGVAVRGATVELRAQGRCIVSSTSREDGTFALACVPSGTYLLEAVEPEAGRACQREIALAPRECIDDLELVIERASAVTGVVVDDDGAPVSAQLVRGCTKSPAGAELTLARTWTSADGAFRLVPDDDRPLYLCAGGADFAEWTSLRSAQPLVRPGTSGIRIQLARRSSCVVTVLDARTRAAVEVFGFAELPVDAGMPRSARDEPEAAPDVAPEAALLPTPTPHARGEVFVYVQSPPQRIVAWAEGYEPCVQALTAEREQVLLLQPCAALRGRLTRAGVPLSPGRVVLRPLGAGSKPQPFGASPRAGEPAPFARGRELRRSIERKARETFVDGGGAFEFTQLDSGRWELLAVDGQEAGMRCVMPEFTLRAAETRDVGALELPPGHASLRLRVLVDEPLRVRDVAALTQLRLNGASIAPGARAEDVDGCTWSGLAPGELEGRIGSHSPLIGELATFRTQLVDGEVSTLDLDLRGQVLCRLEVEVEVDAAFSRVSLSIRAPGDSAIGENAWWERASHAPVSFVLRGGRPVFLHGYADDGQTDGDAAFASTMLELPARGVVATTLRLR